MKVRAACFDAAEILTTPKRCAQFLIDAVETRHPAQIAHALGTLARAKGMREVAEKAGLSHQGLRKSLSDRMNAKTAAMLRVLKVLGVELVAQPAKAKRKSGASRKAA
jgi:probable addiction module antidote protein